MKTTPFFPPIRRFIASALVSLSLLEIGISSANAHPTLQEAVNALSYPRSSQRFLEKGRERLETEIKYLQQNTLASPPSLRTKRELLHKQQFLRQQQERWLEEKLR
ncbi:hypothetical protein [Chroococcidiopsis sp. CCNUC1]|uniref:hypothetical protein n=1 Tax=Chroococcidiopsis sp. CCNUC1 TaxID=2653189 RepID=UPI00202100DC|nr:hypothetical protein [Chroococcidiopsis sp. CCNUC1]URD48488.1 hypothetical protein M5J74_19350 [Chroococcidiopsis sp. CCNUC1]